MRDWSKSGVFPVILRQWHNAKQSISPLSAVSESVIEPILWFYGTTAKTLALNTQGQHWTYPKLDPSLTRSWGVWEVKASLRWTALFLLGIFNYLKLKNAVMVKWDSVALSEGIPREDELNPELIHYSVFLLLDFMLGRGYQLPAMR